MKSIMRWALIPLLALASPGVVEPARAVDATWTPAGVNNDFYNPLNWSTGAVPAGADNALILDPTVQASINFTGSRELGSFHLGNITPDTAGRVDFSSGQLVVHADFDRSHVGDRPAANSTFVMRGSATMLFDEPLAGGGGGFGSSGGNQDLEIGAQTAAGLGLLELHDNAVLRISDDLKIGAEASGNGEVRIDGNARISAGSGISLSEAAASKGKMTVGGTALVVSGNSAGAGNTAQGVTDEGYLTLSTNSSPDTLAELLIKDSAKVYARTLQQRAGLSNMTIQDNGEFHVFDTFNFAAPNLGVATVTGDPFTGFVRASHLGEATSAVVNLLVKNSGKMSIDSAVSDGGGSPELQGLALAGGNNRGANTFAGGAVNIELRDNASFAIQQNLYMTAALAGSAPGASSKLRVVGPNVDAQINGNLYMSFDPEFSLANEGPATLAAVITGRSHSTIDVGGLAHIANGSLAVELSGYSPTGGESYTLLSANSIDGTSFLNADFSLAPLASGLTWDLSVSATSVVLKVLGSTLTAGDFDADGDVDGRDFLVWQRGGSPSPLSTGDLAVWQANYGSGPLALGAAQAIPEPLSLLLAGLALGLLVTERRGRAAGSML